MCTSLTCLQRKKPLVSATQNGQLEISLHAWPPYGMVNLDVFSCNSFSTEDAVAYAKTMFETGDVEIHEVERATRSPRDAMRPLVPHVDATRSVLAGRFAPRPESLT